MECRARRQGPGCLSSPLRDRAAQGEPAQPFWRDKKVLGAMPRSSLSRSTITLIASRTHAPAVVPGGKSLPNLCVPARAARGSRMSERDAAVSGKSLETYVVMWLISKLVARSQARLSQLCSFHDELCAVMAGGRGARITRATFLCRCVTGDSTGQAASLRLAACRRGAGGKKSFWLTSEAPWKLGNILNRWNQLSKLSTETKPNLSSLDQLKSLSPP